ncbi:MAG: hypothetical protein Q4A32_06970 [Lachnospiraceae bacterium]|nr:hypothetical protein [Lachnospiraceae bacterium]
MLDDSEIGATVQLDIIRERQERTSEKLTFLDKTVVVRLKAA